MIWLSINRNKTAFYFRISRGIFPLAHAMQMFAHRYIIIFLNLILPIYLPGRFCLMSYDWNMSRTIRLNIQTLCKIFLICDGLKAEILSNNKFKVLNSCNSERTKNLHN